MSTPSTFPERYIVDGYLAVERSLEEVLRFIPYCAAHENVWSPVLADCIIDASHQLDSLWKVTARQSSCVAPTKELNIKDYFAYFGPAGGGSSIAGRWVVFWGEEAVQLRPFQPWDAGAYQKLPWWSAYTDLKHDRWQNIEKATLREAVAAVSALFLAIVRCEYCRNAVAEAGWLSGKPTWESMSPSHSANLAAWLGEDTGSMRNRFIAAESKLFSYAVGWSKETITAADKWNGKCSHRFREWFDGFVS